MGVFLVFDHDARFALARDRTYPLLVPKGGDIFSIRE
jgi:hypothetical protein